MSMRPLTALLLVLSGAGCATPGHVAAVKTADRLDELTLAVQGLQSAVAATATSLSAVVAAKDGDPTPAFGQFEQSVDALEDARHHAEGRLHGVRAEADAYFLTWKEQVTTITDSDLKEHSEDRRAELEKAVVHVEESMKPAREALDAYSKSLHDTLTYLSIDLGASAIEGVEGRAKSAGKTVKSIDEQLADVLEAVKKARPQFARARASAPAPHKSAPASDEHTPGS